MQKKIWVRIFIGIFVLIALIFVLGKIVAEPWIAHKIRKALIEANPNYTVEVETVNLSLLSGGLELKELIISARPDTITNQVVNGTISSVRFGGVRFLKAMFKKDIDINSVTISDFYMRGKRAVASDTIVARLAPANMHINKVVFENLDLEIGSVSSAAFYKVKEGNLSIHDIQVFKHDTLSRNLMGHFDFNAKEFQWVSSDSLYTVKIIGMDYVESTKLLTMDSFLTLPNYSEYDFTARHRYETDRIESTLQNITVHQFSMESYLESKSVIADLVEIDQMNLQAFRDKRKEMRPVEKLMVQDVMRNYPGVIHIDSLRLLKGDIAYKEHAEDANRAGTITFSNVHVEADAISNDTSRYNPDRPMEIRFRSRLMGEGTLACTIRMNVFDTRNVFSLRGSLSAMEASHLNPILEKNKFVFITSGTIDDMKFNFTADRHKATGEMTMLYRDFEIALKNKRTDETTGLKELAISILANWKIINENPQPGKAVRVGTIDIERDKQKFMFFYCLSSMLSGIQSTLIDRSEGKKEERMEKKEERKEKKEEKKEERKEEREEEKKK